MKEGLEFDGEHMRFEERQESFDKFLAMVRNIDKATGFTEIDDSETPFARWDE